MVKLLNLEDALITTPKKLKAVKVGFTLVRLFKEILNEEICENDLNIFGNLRFYKLQNLI